jgi:hypothetical protein
LLITVVATRNEEVSGKLSEFALCLDRILQQTGLTHC